VQWPLSGAPDRHIHVLRGTGTSVCNAHRLLRPTKLDHFRGTFPQIALVTSAAAKFAVEKGMAQQLEL
jgi:hypothetical protein